MKAQPWNPHKYQKTAVKWLLEHPEAALFLDPGLGKTSITLAALKLLMKTGAVKKALVVAPLRVCYTVWTHDGELGRWRDFEGFKVSLLHGDEKAEAAESDADLYVINPDGLEWLVASGTLQDLLNNRGVDCLVIDELSKFKHPKTRRFKLLKPFLGRFRRRIGLTGTPAANGLLDLFGQVYTLDLGRALGRFITHYRLNYFLPTGFHGYLWRPQPGAEERIYQALNGLALSMRATDHLDLPPLVEQNVYVNLPEKARKAYTELEDDLIAQIDNEVVTAANAAVASMKCRQVASGGIYVSRLGMSELPEAANRREVIHLHDAKTEALTDLVEELQGQPLLVAYEFQHDFERIRKALGDVPAINGQTTGRELTYIVERWNAGKLPVLCGHPAAMGHGLNLQDAGCAHVCWYTPPWDLELYEQTNRRVWRQGVKANRVVIHRLVARRTLDEAVVKALSSKRRGQDALFSALKELYRGRRI